MQLQQNNDMYIVSFRIVYSSTYICIYLSLVGAGARCPMWSGTKRLKSCTRVLRSLQHKTAACNTAAITIYVHTTSPYMRAAAGSRKVLYRLTPVCRIYTIQPRAEPNRCHFFLFFVLFCVARGLYSILIFPMQDMKCKKRRTVLLFYLEYNIIREYLVATM